MRVLLLGSMEVEGSDGAPIAVPGAKLRALLAILALECGQVVSTDRLIALLWQEDPPVGVTNALQRLISKLRKTLGSSEVVRMRPPGYVLSIEPDDVDLHRFERGVAEARAALANGDIDAAASRFEAVDSLWRGPALADFAYEDFAQPHIVRLDAVRLAVREDQVDAELALGQHSRVVGDLDALVAANPLRERMRGQLMLALYRSGRQADALRVYQEGREVLAEELGLDPGPELQRLEAAILNQDPALRAPAAVTTTTRPRTNIKATITPLFGREDELVQLSEALASHRLVTLVGPGGAGKTRLAVDAARRAVDAYAYGVFLIELAPVREAVAVAEAIAAALELPDNELSPAARVQQFCADKDLLLVLDNCEHVIDAAARIAEDLLTAGARVHVLATSREALRVSGEAVWSVPPLDERDATELFIQRAIALDASFSADEVASAVIRDICVRLDGLPLAIELAAARTRAFSVAQIAERLDDRFRLLTGGSRTAMARQQTLRAVVDWSYELLFADERRVFERLAVFPGGCVIGMAEAVCSAGDVEPADVAELVAGLVAKSLLFVDRSEPEPRYRMLQTLSQYGRERLVERGEADAANGRLAAQIADLCARSRLALQGVGQRRWHEAMYAERDNVRAAFEWAVGAEEKEVAVAIAADTALHRWVTGGSREGFRWLGAALSLPGDMQPFVHGWALVWFAFLGYLTGHGSDFDAEFDQGVDLMQAQGDTLLATYGLTFYSQVVAESGRREKAVEINEIALGQLEAAGDAPWVCAVRPWLRAGLASQRDGDSDAFGVAVRDVLPRFRDAGDEFMTAVCLDLVAELDELIGDVEVARTLLREALEIVSSLRMSRFEVALRSRLGVLAVLAGDHAAAEPLLLGALSRAAELSALPVRAQALHALADLRRRQGRLDEAERSAVEALELYRGAGRRFSSSFARATSPLDVPAGLAASCSVLGFVAEALGDAPRACDWHRTSYEEARVVAHPRAVPRGLEGLASAAARSGDAVQAARLLGCADHMRIDRRAARAPSEQFDVDRARDAATALVGEGFAGAYEHGFRSPADAVIEDRSGT